MEYQEIDVSKSKKDEKEMIDKSNQIGVPVIQVEKEIIVGYDLKKLKKILNLK